MAGKDNCAVCNGATTAEAVMVVAEVPSLAGVLPSETVGMGVGVAPVPEQAVRIKSKIIGKISLFMFSLVGALFSVIATIFFYHTIVE
jgi:uncharacterized protein (UPF0212 family)